MVVTSILPFVHATEAPLLPNASASWLYVPLNYYSSGPKLGPQPLSPTIPVLHDLLDLLLIHFCRLSLSFVWQEGSLLGLTNVLRYMSCNGDNA